MSVAAPTVPDALTPDAGQDSAPATGRVTQIIGSTFDAEFPEGRLPEIYNACTVKATNNGIDVEVTGEVQQHLGGDRVRCVAPRRDRRDDPRAGSPVDTGGPVTVPGR